MVTPPVPADLLGGPSGRPGGEDLAGSGNRLVSLGPRAPGTVGIRTEPATLPPDRPGPATEEREVDERDVVAILRLGHGSAISAPLPVGHRLDDDGSFSGRSVFAAVEADFAQSDRPLTRARRVCDHRGPPVLKSLSNLRLVDPRYAIADLWVTGTPRSDPKCPETTVGGSPPRKVTPKVIQARLLRVHHLNRCR